MRSTKMIARAAVCALALAVLPATSQAFGLSGFGGKLGYGIPEDHDGTLVIGGHLEFEHPGSRFHLIPGVIYWSSDDATDVSANMDVYYHFEREGLMTPYLGVGLGVHFIDDERFQGDSNADLGTNLFGGLRFPAGGSHLFLEGRFTMSEIDQFALLGGVTFHR